MNGKSIDWRNYLLTSCLFCGCGETEGGDDDDWESVAPLDENEKKED